MKNIILLIHFLFFTTTGIVAQVTILTRGGDHLFIGIDNAVTLRSTKMDVKKLTLTLAGGTVTGTDGFFTVHCSAPAPQTLVKVWNNGKLVAEKKMDIQRVSDPVVYALGKKLYTSGQIPKSELPQLYALTVKTNVPFMGIIPTRFNYKRMRNGEMLDTYTNNSPEFDAMLKSLLQLAAPGDRIVFENISCSGPDAATVLNGPVSLLVK